ncbi:hypothetical protein K3495_g4170 [Podosphaera aphanis]|nr:hypothetical protein K3495_g4170 [Podosphaera aphanis]
MSSFESRVQDARIVFERNEFSSQRAAAIEFGIPVSTFNYRIRPKRQSHKEGAEHLKLLTSDQELYLVNWIIQLDRVKQALSHVQVRKMVAEIAGSQEDITFVGKNWVYRFLLRHPQIKGITGAPDKSSTYRKAPEDREWVSIVETISDDGRRTRPLIIFKGAAPQSNWFEQEVSDWIYTTSQIGWTANRIAMGWLKTIFLPETKPRDQTCWRILLVDGHESHTNVDFQWECYQNKVHLVYMPPHTSHIPQPLDLSCFSPLKARYRQLIESLSTIYDTASLKKQRFTNCYNDDPHERLAVSRIKAGWRAAGLFPFNRQKGLRNRFTLPTPKQRPTTPEPSSCKCKLHEIHTPRKPADVHASNQNFRDKNYLTRGTTLFMRKVTKSIGEFQAQLAEKTIVNNAQAFEIERLSASKKRKRISDHPNTQFSDIEAIKKAQEAKVASAIDAQNKTRREERATRNAGLNVNHEQTYSLEECLIEIKI